MKHRDVRERPPGNFVEPPNQGQGFKNPLHADNIKGLHEADPLCYLARPEGLEPPTPWFVARYSIQLSYGRYLKLFMPSMAKMIGIL